MEKHLTPLKAIRQKCIDCACGNKAEVRKCTAENCPLFIFRMGHNPNRQGVGSKNIAMAPA